MATETESDEQARQAQEAEATKLQQGYLLRYHPQAGRADRMAANIPGGSQSSWGANGDHTIGHGGSN